MRYDLGIDSTVSRLIPSAFRNPKIYEWVRSFTYPLVEINTEFKTFAEEKILEAKISSQTMLLEHYINYKFKPLFPNPDTDFVSIKHSGEIADATFNKDEGVGSSPTIHLTLFNNDEVGSITPAIYFDNEDRSAYPQDFRVALPISIQGNETLVRGITAIVDKYKIDTKKYDITYIES